MSLNKMNSTLRLDQPERLDAIFSSLRSILLKEPYPVDMDGNQVVFYNFTLDPADHHTLIDGFPKLLNESLGRSLHYDFDSAAGTLRIMVLSQAVVEEIYLTVYSEVKRYLDKIHAHSTAKATNGPQVILWYGEKQQATGDHKDVVISYGTRGDKNASILFVLEDAKPSPANASQGHHVLTANPDAKVVVAFHLSLPDKWFGNENAFKRCAEKSFVVVTIRNDDNPKQPKRVLKESLNVKDGAVTLWLSDFVPNSSLLPKSMIRPGTFHEPKEPNIIIPYSTILEGLFRASDFDHTQRLHIDAAVNKPTLGGGRSMGRGLGTAGPYGRRTYGTLSRPTARSILDSLQAMAGLDGGMEGKRLDSSVDDGHLKIPVATRNFKTPGRASRLAMSANPTIPLSAGHAGLLGDGASLAAPLGRLLRQGQRLFRK